MGKRGDKEHAMTHSVDSRTITQVWDGYESALTTLRVLLFCMKYPKLKFTTECVAVNQGVEKAALEKEIENLIGQGILGKGSDGGITYFYLNRTRQELTELTEGFLRDWRSHEVANRS